MFGFRSMIRELKSSLGHLNLSHRACSVWSDGQKIGLKQIISDILSHSWHYMKGCTYPGSCINVYSGLSNIRAAVIRRKEENFRSPGLDCLAYI